MKRGGVTTKDTKTGVLSTKSAKSTKKEGDKKTGSFALVVCLIFGHPATNGSGESQISFLSPFRVFRAWRRQSSYFRDFFVKIFVCFVVKNQNAKAAIEDQVGKELIEEISQQSERLQEIDFVIQKINNEFAACTEV